MPRVYNCKQLLLTIVARRVVWVYPLSPQTSTTLRPIVPAVNAAGYANAALLMIPKGFFTWCAISAASRVRRAVKVAPGGVGSGLSVLAEIWPEVQAIVDGDRLIEVSGCEMAQVNGLSVVDLQNECNRVGATVEALRQGVDVVRLESGGYPGQGEVLTDVQNANVGVGTRSQYDGVTWERSDGQEVHPFGRARRVTDPPRVSADGALIE